MERWNVLQRSNYHIRVCETRLPVSKVEREKPTDTPRACWSHETAKTEMDCSCAMTVSWCYKCTLSFSRPDRGMYSDHRVTTDGFKSYFSWPRQNTVTVALVYVNSYYSDGLWIVMAFAAKVRLFPAATRNSIKVVPGCISPWHRASECFWGRVPKFSINFEQILPHVLGNFEEENCVLRPSIIIN
jgi:hypothetical protein